MTTADATPTEPEPDFVMPAVGYTELLGVDVPVLDELAELRDGAYGGAVSLMRWREEYAVIVADVALPAPADVERLRSNVTHHMLEDPDADASPEDEDARWAHGRTVLRHVTALKSPPDDDEARELYRNAVNWRQDNDLDGLNAQQRARIAERARANQRVLREWLRELGDFAEFDEETGLPRDTIASRRTIADDELGAVPTSEREARATAWLDATPEQRQSAAEFADPEGPNRSEADWKMTQATSQLSRVMAVEFIRFARNDDSDAGRAVRDLWDNGDLREVLARYVDRR